MEKSARGLQTELGWENTSTLDGHKHLSDRSIADSVRADPVLLRLQILLLPR